MTSNESGFKVWIDQDLCTGDGLCEELAPDVFFGGSDGLFYVKEVPKYFGTEKLFDGVSNPAMSEGMARVPGSLLDVVIEAADECPGECIFIEADN
jgi:ferredoxin